VRYRQYSSRVNNLALILILIFLIFLISSYRRSIFALYPHFSVSDFLLRSLLQRYCCKYKDELNLDEEIFKQWYETEVKKSRNRPGSSGHHENLWKRTLKYDGDRLGFFTTGRLLRAVLYDFEVSFYRISQLCCSASRMALHK
jgi:hypothetical protein